MARALLINPFIYDITAFDFWAKPKGLLEVGRLLLNLGLQVDFIDCLDRSDPEMAAEAGKNRDISPQREKDYGTGRYYRQRVTPSPSLRGLRRRYYRYGFTPDLLRRKLSRLPRPPALIGVTGVMTYWSRGVRETIALAKEVFPDVPVVLGGIYPTLMPDYAALHSGADAIFTGVATHERLAALLDSFAVPHGVLDKDAALERGGFWGYYPYRAPRYGIVKTSVGCHKACTYCASRRLHPRFHGFDPEELFRELAFFAALGVRDIAFYDDALLYGMEDRIAPLLARVEKDLPRLRFHTPNGMHLDLVDHKTARLQRRGGFTTLRFGFESSSAELNRRIGEKLDMDRFRDTIAMLVDAGFDPSQIGIYVMIGIPGQSVEVAEESILFVKRCGVRPYITEYSPIPGTVEYARALSASPVDFAADPELQNNSFLPLRDPTFHEDEVNRLKRLCYQEQKT